MIVAFIVGYILMAFVTLFLMVVQQKLRWGHLPDDEDTELVLALGTIFWPLRLLVLACLAIVRFADKFSDKIAEVLKRNENRYSRSEKSNWK